MTMQKLPRGFLPEHDPLTTLPKAFKPWEDVANNLPKLLVAGLVKETIELLPDFPVNMLENDREQERAMQILSYLGHAYVWGHREPPQAIPAILAKPWYEIATKCNRLPVLSYASYALTNWKRLDPQGPIDLGNIVLIQNFLGGIDEEWFILIHVAIEAQSIPALNACLDILEAVNTNDEQAVQSALKIVESALKNMCETLDRMPEACDPYIYYTRVRPYIFGWKNHPLFPNGLIYEGVYDNKPQQFRGETGAQSSIIPTLDGLLGITHTQDMLYTYLQEMRDYMPKPHREFLAYIESQSKLRAFVQSKPSLKPLYNSCITLINRFRQTHLKYAASYIQKQHQATSENPTAVGTGGTPFMAYLKKHQDETEKFLLD